MMCDLSGVTDMTGMFAETSFNGDLSSWNVSSVTDMSDMFYETSFNGNLSSWDVSSVTDMSYMFIDASSFNGDLSSWDVSSVTNMTGMFFSAASFNGDLSSWNVSSVTDMSEMLASISFNQTLSSWDVSSVTDMSNMFAYTSSFNQTLSSWDVSSVTNMTGMFSGVTSFNQPLSSWNVSSVTDMSNMFSGASSFNQTLSSWDVSSVTDMLGMFAKASSFDQNLGNWYVVPADTTYATSEGTLNVTTISAQNAFLDNPSPSYAIGSGGNSTLFNITDSKTLMFKSTPSADTYNVNVTASGTNVFESGNNWRVLEIRVTGQTSDNTPPTLSLTGDTSVTISAGTTYNDEGATCEDTVDGTIIPTVVSNTVDTTQVGNYAVTYSCTDAANNSATQVSRTVIVEDTTPPTLSLTGDTSVTISAGTTYNDEGATCEDTVDGTIIPTVVSNTVDTTQVGNYAVTYSCTDAANNSATQVSRTVIVEDTTPPTLSLTGDTSVTISAGTTYNDEGATCEDTVDGTIIPTVVSNTVDTTQVGNYAVTYSCTDAANNSATQVSRTVIVEDTTPPTLSLTGDTSVTISAGTTYNDEGATCEDTVDGTIIPTVVSNTVDTTQVGNYAVTYSCTDAANNSATQVSRTVIVEDTTPPTLSLTGDTSVTISAGTTYNDEGATCEDTVDGTIIPTVVSNTVDTTQVGNYAVTYSCTDAANNSATQVSRTVIVEDTTPPTLSLTGDTSVTISAGTTYNDEGATCEDTVDGTIIPTVVSNTVDTTQVGNYTVTYSCIDTAGNQAIQVSRMVTVEDTTVPVITLTGSSSVTIEVGDSYSDDGAECTDTVDGTITPTKTFDDVDTSQVGSYTVTYSCVDTAGNQAMQVSRMVNVETSVTLDTTAPVLTLTGSSSVTIEANDTYSDDGAECTDTVDGTITPTKTFDDVDTSQVGSYTVTYSCVDTAGNQAMQVSRMVTVEDTTVPVITLTGSNPATVTVNTTYSDEGATCTDAVDGTRTVTTDNQVNTGTVGTYSVIYSCSDTSNNEATATRTVNVQAAVDITDPVITIIGSNPATVTVNTTYSDEGATCTDAVDGTRTVTTDNQVNTGTVGTYSVIYSCSDTSNNEATATRTVNVQAAVDITDPVITIIGSNPATVTVNTTYSDEGATCTDAVDGTRTVTTDNQVNTGTVGTYSVIYSCSDTSNNEATATRMVIVQQGPDTTPPVIIIHGSNPATVTVNTTYSDAGATCRDNFDGDFAPISAISTVNASKAGSYTVTYTCIDAENNESERTRTVRVLEEGDFTRSKSSKSTPLTVDNDVIIDGKSHDIGGSGTVTIKQNEVMTGEPVDITFTAHSADDIIHLTVYLNLHGDDTGYAYSDTYIRYDHGTVQIHDPHNFISDASITITDDTEQPDKKIIDIIIEFDGDMGLTNMVLYMWNEDRRSQLIRILDAFEVAAPQEPEVQAADPEPLEPDSELPADPEPVAPDLADDVVDPEPVPSDTLWPDDYDEAQVLHTIRMWSGFESELITDTQLLELLGLEDYQDIDLPDWMMTQLGVLVAKGDVTVDEFVLALQYVLTHA